ncbi:MAG: hypothetical protein N4A37_10635 [Prolixibacteraceae bacterium]|nr:hypothetical protein [Prolixibacteraceae bacterium]
MMATRGNPRTYSYKPRIPLPMTNNSLDNAHVFSSLLRINHGVWHHRNEA